MPRSEPGCPRLPIPAPIFLYFLLSRGHALDCLMLWVSRHHRDLDATVQSRIDELCSAKQLIFAFDEDDGYDCSDFRIYNDFW
ncbi:hypothetical protein DFH08DRAFT_957588 [Mycena albidolilacea]|uniref:Uncharacterized protein n=1 Tax=Mycena albidolilacea TaxID=1033008 RepID=A0AAD7ETM8_9AGAR|nr:hypothetical protein DFH08DRAFT_957588 [Mycena albidolilacea]